MNKAVIFDLDGTLLDSLPDISYHINLMLSHFGYRNLAPREIMKFIGNGARRLVRDCIGVEISEEELDERLGYYNDIYTSSGSPYSRMFDGVREMLDELKNRGYKIAVLTNKPQETTDNVIETVFNGVHFDIVLGQSKNVKCKPDKSATMMILNRLNVLPENAYFVGDGETDALTAINADIKGISVLWGYREREQLEAVGARLFVSTPEELLTILD